MSRSHRFVLLGLLACAGGCSPDSPTAAEVRATAVPGGSTVIDAGGPMFVEECSLGCNSGAHGMSVACSGASVHVNEDVAIRFSRFVDLASVNPASFHIEDLATGNAPPGSFLVSPGDARRLVFRPALTFAPDGSPQFGFEAGASYRVVLHGTSAGDPPPYVRSQEGRANESRMDCTVSADRGVLDYAPGAPSLAVFVDRVDPQTGEILPDQPAEGATDVSVATEITLVFDDVMNLATVVNPSTGEAPFLRVELEPEQGAPSSSRIPITGTWTVAIQIEPPRTTAVFHPERALPSLGADPASSRAIVLSAPSEIVDLVGNALADAGEVRFRTQRVDYAGVELPAPGGEPFEDDSNEDVARSGANWGGGSLAFGRGGGSGRLGELVVRAGETLALATAGEVFPRAGAPQDVLDNSIPLVDYDPGDASTWPTVTADGSGLEFSAMRVEEGARLELAGSSAARLFSRGELDVRGDLSVAGGAALDHRSNSGRQLDLGQETAFGGEGGAPGPAAGGGGRGADRLDLSRNPLIACMTLTLTLLGGVYIPDSPQNPGADNGGRAGRGVGGTAGSGGRGGVRWPPTPPFAVTLNPPSICTGDLELSPVLNPSSGQWECRCAMVGGAGGGGAYARDGGDGLAFSPYISSQPGLLPLTPGPTPGGDSGVLGLELPGTEPPLVRDLDWHSGELRGGSGGGGGGMSLWGTKSLAFGGAEIQCFTPPALIAPFFDHSAAGGGGGGGALQLVSGRALRIDGRVDASGGDGGGSLDPSGSLLECTNVQQQPDCGDFAAPGGGGSGGAIRLQGSEVELASLPARLSVLGGSGGLGVGGSLGGDGGPGLVRIESAMGALFPDELAPSIEPYYPGDLTFNQPYLSAAILSLGAWKASVERPDSYSAGMSCWMRGDADAFALVFADDDPSAPNDPEAKGWNLDVLYATPNGVVALPYRGIPNDPNFPLTGTDFESFFGNLVNHDQPEGQGSLFCVRFQGAHSTHPLDDPCDVDLSDAGGDIVPGSLTPWVRHPAELNLFDPPPDVVRFTVVFDRSLRSQGLVQSRVRGVTRLRIDATPD